MTITINPLQRQDRNEWESLYRGYAEFYKVPMEQSTLDQVWHWIFDSNTEFFAFMAKDNNGNGLGLMHFRAMPSPIRGALVGFLDDMYIIPNARGQGLVDDMFAVLKQQARIKGCPFVRWITAEDNYRGRAVYDRVSSKTHWQTYQMACD